MAKKGRHYSEVAAAMYLSAGNITSRVWASFSPQRPRTGTLACLSQRQGVAFLAELDIP